MACTDVDVLVQNYLRRLDKAAAREYVPYVCRSALMGQVRRRVRASVTGVPVDEAAVRAVLAEIGSPECLAARVARCVGLEFPQSPRVNRSALLAVLLGALWLGGVGSVLAIRLARSARGAISLSDGRQRGKRLAAAATVLGLTGLLGAVLLGVALVMGVPTGLP